MALNKNDGTKKTKPLGFKHLRLGVNLFLQNNSLSWCDRSEFSHPWGWKRDDLRGIRRIMGEWGPDEVEVCELWFQTWTLYGRDGKLGDDGTRSTLSLICGALKLMLNT